MSGDFVHKMFQFIINKFERAQTIRSAHAACIFCRTSFKPLEDQLKSAFNAPSHICQTGDFGIKLFNSNIDQDLQMCVCVCVCGGGGHQFR